MRAERCSTDRVAGRREGKFYNALFRVTAPSGQAGTLSTLWLFIARLYRTKGKYFSDY